MRRLAFLSMVLAGVFLLGPSEAQAQMCDDKCVDIHDEEGNHVGFGCTTGGAWDKCEATTSKCELDSCGLTSIMLDDGTHWVTLPSCQLDALTEWGEVVAGEDARGTRVTRIELLTG